MASHNCSTLRCGPRLHVSNCEPMPQLWLCMCSSTTYNAHASPTNRKGWKQHPAASTHLHSQLHMCAQQSRKLAAQHLLHAHARPGGRRKLAAMVDQGWRAGAILLTEGGGWLGRAGGTLRARGIPHSHSTYAQQTAQGDHPAAAPLTRSATPGFGGTAAGPSAAQKPGPYGAPAGLQPWLAAPPAARQSCRCRCRRPCRRWLPRRLQ